MKTKFTAKELIAKGFTLIQEEGSELYYLEYIFNKEDYIHSKFLTTNDVSKQQLPYTILSVANGVYKEGEPVLTEAEIDYLIKKYTV